MSEINPSINVSVVNGWGTNAFDVSAGVVDAGGLVVQVECIACVACRHPFKVSDAVALVTLVDSSEMVRVYHMDCLPVEYGFAFPALSVPTREKTRRRGERATPSRHSRRVARTVRIA